MAVETEIDSLVLDISVKDTSSGETSAKKISTLDRVLVKFQKTIQNLDTKTFKSKFSSMATALKPFVNQLNSAKSTLTALDRILKKSSLNGVSKAVAGDTKVGEQNTPTGESGGGTMPKASSGSAPKLASGDIENETLESLKKKYGELTKTIDSADNKRTLFFERYDGSNKITTKYTADLQKQGKKLKEVAGSFKYVGQTSSEVTGGGLKSFFLSIKRIALYRLIRTSLKLITDAMKDGINNIVEFDASAKETMSEVTSSITVMKNSVGSVMMPLLELVTPLIQGISKAVGALANGISYLTAKLKGESTWLKVNTDYMKEYNKASKLLSYDEFSTMSNTENDTTGMFTKESVEGSSLGGIIEDANALLGILAGISTYLGIIGTAKIIGLITSGTLAAGISTVWATSLGFLGTIKGMALSISVLVGGLVMFLTSLDQMSTAAKIIIPILAILLGVLAGIAIAHAAAKAGVAAPVMAGITAGALAAGIVMIAGTAIAVSQHANGGMFEGTGTLYHQAGERGAEIVAQGSRGTGVVNVIQFKQAMVEALTEYNAAKSNDNDGGDIVLEVDGKELARAQVINNANALKKNYNIELNPR